MKLIYRITIRLSVVLLPIMAVWAMLFYFTMVDEINDEADDALEDYSELLITRSLAGHELTAVNNGSNNSYSIVEVDKLYADTHPHVTYYDTEIFIPEKNETEPARVLKSMFIDSGGRFYEIMVAIPTFEKKDLFESILYWIILLYLLLLMTIIGITVFVFHRSLSPLYTLLKWFDKYTPGGKNSNVPSNSHISEFRKLSEAVQRATNRSEELFDRQKQFIGNASHELQTPLAVLGNRIEWLINNTSPTQMQIEELGKMQYTLRFVVKQNKTLLLLTKIDNGQFPENSVVNINNIIENQINIYEEVYESRKIACTMDIKENILATMNESLVSILITNLLKNAYIYSPEGGNINVSTKNGILYVCNDGIAALNAEHIFDRFYQGTKRDGSTGLGLALVESICRYYRLNINYRFEDLKHCFSINLQNLQK